MNLIDNFYETKNLLDELCKNLFILFEQNDKYGIIKIADVKYLDISLHKQSKDLLIVNLYNYHDVLPRESFEFDRQKLMQCDESTIEEWFVKCKEIIVKTYTAKLKKFYKEFPESDFKLLHAGIVNYSKLNATMTNNEIASHVAKYVVESLEN